MSRAQITTPLDRELTINWNRITLDLYVGSCPQSPDDLHTLADIGIGFVVNLQMDEDIESHSLPWHELEPLYAERAFEVVRVPINDGDWDSMHANLLRAIETVRGALDDGWAVYLHCTSGVNRAPTVAIGYLAACTEMSIDEAASHVCGIRQCLPFVDVVEAVLGDVEPS